MTIHRFILAIDQGTTSTRAILFDRAGRPHATAQRELPQVFPAPGLVEHDPDEIWRATLAVCGELHAGPGEIAAIGITNQRETTVLWDRATGRPLHNAIVWQDRRTEDLCRRLEHQGAGTLVQERTGLLLDPYFSATKLAWLLDHVDGARARAERGELCFGTIDAFLLWRLTGGAVHATDATNAARTMLFDIHRGDWDDELLALFGVPREVLPEVRDNAADFGTTDPSLLGAAIPVAGMAGDQQAATIGQACLEAGMIKSTYGTGCFALLHTGPTALRSQNRLLATVASKLDGRTSYALEGSIFAAGSTVQWLRDGLGIVRHAGETEALAAEADPAARVLLVPAFTGLGAPYWDAAARGAIFGLTRGSGRAEIARAALEAVGYQTRDLIEAMRADGAAPVRALRVDGGMANNGFAMQFLADVLGIAVERPRVTETTALGAAFLAGVQSAFFESFEATAELWEREAVFEPEMTEAERDERYGEWKAAVASVLTRR